MLISIPIRLFSKLICDTNGQPRHHSRRNHSRILAEPHFFYTLEIIMTHNDYSVIGQDMRRV